MSVTAGPGVVQMSGVAGMAAQQGVAFAPFAPSLVLDFLGRDTLQPGITFTRSSNATYFDSRGTLRTAGTDVARFDFNPSTLVPLGLLIEEQRTNSIIQSDDLSNAAFTNNGVTVTGGQADPKGGTSATLITADTSTGNHQRYQDSSGPVAGQVSVVTCFVKQDGGNRYAMVGDGGDSAWHTATIDFQTGTISNSTGATGRVLSGPDAAGFYRVEVISTRVSGVGTFRPFVAPMGTNNGTVPGYTGLGTETVIAFGLQLEKNVSFSTSYITTGAAAATRNADAASLSSLAFFNAIEGTLYAEGDQPQVSISGTNFGIWNFFTTNGNNSINLLVSGANNRAQMYVVNGGVDQAFIETAGLGPTAGTRFKIAGAYKANNFAAYFNGTSMGTDSSGSIPAVASSTLGNYFTQYRNGHIARLVYYPRRLSNIDMQRLTA